MSMLRDNALVFIDRFLPPKIGDEDPIAASRCRMVIITAYALIPIGLFFIAFYWLSTGEIGPVTITLGLLIVPMVLVPFMVRRLGSSQLPGALVCVMVMVALVAPEVADGGYHPSNLPWFAMVPLIGAFLVGPRFAIGSALFMFAYLIANFVLLANGVKFTTNPAPETRALILASTGATLLFSGVFAWFFDAARRRSQRRLDITVEALREANNELIEARDRAHAANAAKVQFVANMSHELRTPMNGVIGMTDLLMESSLADEQKDYAETIRASANSLLAIIDDVLDFSKLEFDKLKLDRQDLELEVLMDEVIAIVGNHAYDRGLELSLQVSPHIPFHTVGDPVRLRQVLLNLLTNAIKFTEQGEVGVFVTRPDPAGDPRAVRFEVRDTGLGIAPDLLPQIFDSFYQTDASQTRRHGGVGLGLAISKRLVELMGGTLRVQSQVDEGTRFWFDVEFGPSDIFQEDFDDHSRTLQGLRALALLPKNRPMATEAIRELLARDGVELDIVHRRSDVEVELVAKSEEGRPYRLCLVDADLDPDLRLAEAIALLDVPDRPSFVLITEPRAQKIRATADTRGFASTVTKPIRRGHLMACVAFALRRPVPEFDETQSLDTLEVPPARVLVAEDNDVNRRLALLMLERLGFEGDAVPDGQAVLEACQQQHYDAILMDLQMPRLDGYATTAKIRRQPGDLRHVSIIAMSANVQASDRQRCLDAGMNDFIAKPVKLEQLKAVLEKWLFGAVPVPWVDTPSGETPLPDSPLDHDLLASLQRLAGDQEDLFGELIEAFLDEAPEAMKSIQDFVDRLAFGALSDTAHKLKSSSGNLGAQRLSALLIRVERAADTQDGKRCAKLLDEVRREFARVEIALRDYRPAATSASA